MSVVGPALRAGGGDALAFRLLDLVTASFVAILLLSNIASTKIVALPPAPGYDLADEFHTVLGLTPRIFVGSLVGFGAGSFVNSAVLARLKVATQGRWLWLRTVASTLAGQAADTVLFLTVAFWGVFPDALLLAVFVSNYAFKVGVEVAFSPLTYLVVNGLKRAEGVDVFDVAGGLSPFPWSRAERSGRPEARRGTLAPDPRGPQV